MPCRISEIHLVHVVKNIAQKLGATPAQVLIAWGVKRGYSVIPKSVQESKFPVEMLIAYFANTDCLRPNNLQLQAN